MCAYIIWRISSAMERKVGDAERESWEVCVARSTIAGDGFCDAADDVGESIPHSIWNMVRGMIQWLV